MKLSLSRRRRWVASACAGAVVLVIAAVGASAGTNQPPTGWFVDYKAPSTIASADFAGEPSIGVDWRTGAVLYQASGSTYRVNLDAGTWTDVSSPYTSFNVDPILATDSRTGFTLAGGDDESCSILAATNDDGTTWSPALPCTFTPDHPTVGIGPQVGSTGQQQSTIAYYCQQYPLEDECTASTDGGLVWTPAVPVTGGCIGVSGHVKISADGTAYLPIRACNIDGDMTGTSGAEVGGAVSRDNGRTWTSYFIHGASWPYKGFDPSVATTPDNTVYESWAGFGDYHPLVAWSHDHGATWSKPVDVSAGSHFPIAASTFQAMVAGDNGRVAVAYLGADTPPAANSTVFDSGYVGAWYLYVSLSLDGGKTWTTMRAQDTPVQRGPICDSGTKCISGRNLLDFMDATVDARGAILIGYADGCVTNCTSTSPLGASSDAWASIARQEHGASLFASVGNLG
jgi:hypothetical protein